MSQGRDQNFDMSQIPPNEQPSHEDGNVDNKKQRQASRKVQRQSQSHIQTPQQPQLPCINQPQLQLNPTPPLDSSAQSLYPQPTPYLYGGNPNGPNQVSHVPQSSEYMDLQPLNRPYAPANVLYLHPPVHRQFASSSQEDAEPTSSSGQSSSNYTVTDQQHRFQIANARNLFNSSEGIPMVPMQEVRMAPPVLGPDSRQQGFGQDQPYNPQLFGYYPEGLPTQQYPSSVVNLVNPPPFDEVMKELPNPVAFDDLELDGQKTTPSPTSTHTNKTSSLLIEERVGNQCPHCRKKFRRPSSLQTHIYTHTGEKPFQCRWPRCDRRFSVRSNMVRHYRLHKRANKQGPEDKE
ncbi:BA75_05009T0 [Komagataella pastoris]|uniref:BA75_05009T0 n=1 Tax=Komagataella pastoris TaxID=4922 RepID=A0A1B2JJC7_PICPA|nr:BA75_05009T0 [Komagataella pastoris]